MVRTECMATIGAVSNPDQQNISIGKAGRNAGWASALGARRRDEPGRSSAWRRRRPHLGRPPPGHALGQADQGQEDPAEQEDRRHDHRAAAASASRGGRMWLARSGKGPFVDGYLLKKAEHVAGIGAQRGDQDLVAALDDPAAVRRPHLRRLQRPEVHAGARDREHDRPQVRRVLADPDLPRPCGRTRKRRGA